jgi:hypothetical protein
MHKKEHIDIIMITSFKPTSAKNTITALSKLQSDDLVRKQCNSETFVMNAKREKS